MYVVYHHHPVDDEEKFFVQVLVLVDSLLRREKLKSQEKPGEALSVILVRKSISNIISSITSGKNFIASWGTRVQIS